MITAGRLARTQETFAGSAAPRAAPLVARLVVVAGVAAGVLFVLLGRYVLPTKYFSDDVIIQSIAQRNAPFVPDQSFQHTADVYRWLGLADAPLFVGLATLLLCCLVLAVAARPVRILIEAPAFALFFSTAIVLNAVYVAQFSKEALLLPIALLFVVFPARKPVWSAAILLSSLLLYAYFVRTYWFLIAALSLIVVTALQRLGRRAFVFVPPLLVLAVGLAFHLALGVNSDHFREVLNATRPAGDTTNTLILPLVSVDSLGTDLINTVLEGVLLVVPIPLLVTLSPGYVLAALGITVMWVWLGREVWAHLTLPPRHRSFAFAVPAALIVSLLLTQSFFEPDYGSYLKHLSPLLPVVLYLLVFRFVRASGEAPKAWVPSPGGTEK